MKCLFLGVYIPTEDVGEPKNIYLESKEKSLLFKELILKSNVALNKSKNFIFINKELILFKEILEEFTNLNKELQSTGTVNILTELKSNQYFLLKLVYKNFNKISKIEKEYFKEYVKDYFKDIKIKNEKSYKEMINLINYQLTSQELSNVIERLKERDIEINKLKKLLTNKKEILSKRIDILKDKVDNLAKSKLISLIELKFFYVMIEELNKEVGYAPLISNTHLGLPS